MSTRQGPRPDSRMARQCPARHVPGPALTLAVVALPNVDADTHRMKQTGRVVDAILATDTEKPCDAGVAGALQRIVSF